MKPAEIASYVLQHDARNLRLKRRLAERGIDGRGEYQVTCRFRAATRGQASELARELRQKGFAAEMTPGRGGRGGRFWRVDAQRRQSLEEAASHAFTEEMVRSAAALACFYDGWEARVTDQEP